MNEIKITEKDLIGEIKRFPIEVVRKMVEEQVRQGNKADVSIFQKKNYADKENGGFKWKDTEEGFEFWDMVIIYEEFDKFFEKYPKQETTEMQDAENTATQAYKEIDWEARRFEIVKTYLHGILTSPEIVFTIDKLAETSVKVADAIISKMKGGSDEKYTR